MRWNINGKFKFPIDRKILKYGDSIGAIKIKGDNIYETLETKSVTKLN